MLALWQQQDAFCECIIKIQTHFFAFSSLTISFRFLCPPKKKVLKFIFRNGEQFFSSWTGKSSRQQKKSEIVNRSSTSWFHETWISQEESKCLSDVMFDPEKTPSYFLKERSKKKRVTWSARQKSTCKFDLPEEQHSQRKVQMLKWHENINRVLISDLNLQNDSPSSSTEDDDTIYWRSSLVISWRRDHRNRTTLTAKDPILGKLFNRLNSDVMSLTSKEQCCMTFLNNWQNDFFLHPSLAACPKMSEKNEWSRETKKVQAHSLYCINRDMNRWLRGIKPILN